jgi:hypothetical protein
MCIIYHFKYNSILKRDFQPSKYNLKIFWISGWAKNRWEKKGKCPVICIGVVRPPAIKESWSNYLEQR